MAETKKVQVVFSVKDNEFNKSLNQMNSQIKLTKSQLQQSAAQLNVYGSNIKNLSEKHTLLKTQIQNVTEKMNKYQESVTKNTEKLNTNKQALANLGSEKQKLTQQYNAAVKQYGKESEEALKLKESLEKCKSEYSEMENKVKDNVKTLNNHQANVNKAKAEITGLEGELKKCSKAIAENSNGFLNASKKFESAGKKLQTIGGGISDAGGKLMSLSAPMVAVGAGAIKVGMDFEQAMADLQATSGATAEDFDRLKNKAEELGANTCKSATDSAQAMKYLALAGYSVQQQLEATEPILKASVGWGAEMSQTSDMTTDSMSALNLKVEDLGHYLDVCSQAQRSSNTSAIQLQEAFISCGGSLTTLGIPLEEATTHLGRLADQGKKGSEAGNGLNSVLVNLLGTTDTTEGALNKLGVEVFDSNGKFRGLTTVLKDVKNAMANWTDEEKAMIEAQLGGKTQMDTLYMLLNGLGDGYDNLSNKINNCSGVTEEMYDVMQNTTKGKIDAFKSKLEALGITLADNLLPHLTDIIDVAGNLVDWFSNLDSGTQSLILNTGLLTFATGGLLKSIGSTTKGIGAMMEGGSKLLGWLGKTTSATKAASLAAEGAEVTTAALSGSVGVFSGVLLPLVGVIGTVAAGIYTISQANKLANSTVLDATDDMSAMEQVMAILTDTQRYSKEQLEELGFKYKEFSSDITPETKESLESTADKFRNLQTEIDRIDISGAISDEDKNNLVNNAQDLCNTILQKLDGLQSDSYNKLKETFRLDGVISEEEQKILNGMDSGATEIKNKIGSIQNDIKVLQENGSLETEQGRQELKDKMLELEDLYSQELKAKKVANEQDIQAFQDEANSLDLQKATELLSSKKEIFNQESEAVHSKYDAGIQALKNYYEQADATEKPAIQQQIDNLSSQRDKELGIAGEKYQGYLNIINEKYPEMRSQINILTGQMMNDTDSYFNSELQKTVEHYQSINTEVGSGYQSLYNTTTETWDKVYVKIDEATGQVIGVVDTYTGEMGSYSKDVQNSLGEEANKANETANSMSGAFSQMAGATINNSGQIVGANGNIIGSLDNVTSHADGTRSGIMNLNGTPIAVSCDNNGAINGLNEVERKANNLDGKRVSIWTTIKQSFQRAAQSFAGDSDGYATGTSNVNNSGTYNVNEKGMELFDNISGNAGISLASYSPTSYESAYLNSGTKVTNALMTTAKMNREISRNVDSKTSSAINSLVGSLSQQFANSLKNLNVNNSGIESINFNPTIVLGGKEYREFKTSLTKDVVKTIDRDSKRKE